MVYVLPEPVTPKRVLYWFPASIDSLNAFMAWGWSPAGSYSLTTLNSVIINPFKVFAY